MLVHAGGIEISRTLSDKEPKEFDLVFDVKADGFFSLLQAAEGMPIGATVVFSSVAGRFGNAGQTDYSAANDLLCKMSSSAAARRGPRPAAIAIDWTAWGGIGMATRGSIPQIMEAAGIDMLPPESGHPDRPPRARGGRRLAARSSWPARSASWARSSTRPAGWTSAKAQAELAGARAAAADGRRGQGGAAVRRPRRRDDARSEGAAVPVRPPDRRRRRCCPA